MRFRFRTPFSRKSIAARTKGRATRAVKKAVVPGYGRKGMGWAKNPEKAAKTAVHHRTTRSIFR